MADRHKDIGILKNIQWLSIGCFVIVLFWVLAFLITAHDWNALAWFPVAMFVYFLAQALAYVALSGGAFRPKHIYRIALAPLIVAMICLVGVWISFAFGG